MEFDFEKEGWTVTVAGTYSDDMAPDVQMHLSFPNRSTSQGNKPKPYRSIDNSKEFEHEIHSNSFKDDHSQDRKPAILPPPHSIKLNPRRSLTKSIFGMGTEHWIQSCSLSTVNI